jgi:hypothetical protein
VIARATGQLGGRPPAPARAAGLARCPDRARGGRHAGSTGPRTPARSGSPAAWSAPWRGWPGRAGRDHALAADTSALREAAARLATAPGVGPVLATTLLARLPELGRAPPKAVATLGAVRANPRLRGLYRRLREAGKPAKVAPVAAVRKLLAHLDTTDWRSDPADRPIGSHSCLDRAARHGEHVGAHEAVHAGDADG